MKKLLISMGFVCATAAHSVCAYDTGTWLIRGGLTQVSPQDSSGHVIVANNDLGLGVNVNNNAQVGLNLVYFTSPHLALELLAATPFSHGIGLDTVGKLGSTKHLPPTISTNYYFNDGDGKFQPYAGVGVNYTVFFNEKFTSANANAGFSDLKLDNSFGLSAQLGADYAFDEHWQFNASVRWIDIDTQANFKLNGASGKVDVSIDPLVYSITLGYRF